MPSRREALSNKILVLSLLLAVDHHSHSGDIGFYILDGFDLVSERPEPLTCWTWAESLISLSFWTSVCFSREAS